MQNAKQYYYISSFLYNYIEIIATTYKLLNYLSIWSLLSSTRSMSVKHILTHHQHFYDENYVYEPDGGCSLIDTMHMTDKGSIICDNICSIEKM